MGIVLYVLIIVLATVWEEMASSVLHVFCMFVRMCYRILYSAFAA